MPGGRTVCTASRALVLGAAIVVVLIGLIPLFVPKWNARVSDALNKSKGGHARSIARNSAPIFPI
jgi:uncharacterized protein YjeT (DUF2065 family)